MLHTTSLIASTALVLGFVSAIPTSTSGLITTEVDLNGTSPFKYEGAAAKGGLITTKVDLNGTSPYDYAAALEERGGEPTLGARASFYACTEPHWKGECWHANVQFDATCERLDNFAVKQISSFGPDRSVVCELYDDSRCTGKSKVFNYPGHPDLAQIKFDNVAWAVRCWFKWEKGV